MIYTSIPGFFAEHFKDIFYISGAVATFFIGKKMRSLNVKKAEVDVQATELGNVETALHIYKIMLKDLQEKLQEAEHGLEVIEKRYSNVMAKNYELIEKNKFLKKQLDEITGNSE